MTALYDPDTGVRTACTVVQFDRVQVVSHKTREKNGYYAVASWDVDGDSLIMLGSRC